MTDAEPAARHVLAIEALTADGFAPFGEVIEAAAHTPRFEINAGYAQRFDDLARVDTGAEGGRTRVSIFRALPRTLPLQLGLVERHVLGSQAFVPLAGQRFLVVVAPPGPAPVAEGLRCFITAPGQGVNMSRGTWHHPLLALDAGGDFLVIDRAPDRPTTDCEVHDLVGVQAWVTG